MKIDDISIEDLLKDYILGKYKSLRAFTTAIELPYTTVNNIFKRGLSNSGVVLIGKICAFLDISVEDLIKGKIVENTTNNTKCIVQSLDSANECHYSGIRKSDGAYVENVPQEDIDKIINSLSNLSKADIDALSLFMKFLIYKNQSKE